MLSIDSSKGVYDINRNSTEIFNYLVILLPFTDFFAFVWHLIFSTEFGVQRKTTCEVIGQYVPVRSWLPRYLLNL